MMRIEAPPPTAVSSSAQCAVLRLAVHSQPDLLTLRVRLAKRLIELDAFAEAIDVLQNWTGKLDTDAHLLLADAYFARNDPGDNECATMACERALALTNFPAERAAALARLGKALSRDGYDSRACLAFHEALALDPHNVTAFKRLTLPLLREGKYAALLALITNFESSGVYHTRLLGARLAALAGMGREVEARHLFGPSQFFHHAHLPPPQGWRDSAHFCSALEAEIEANPARRIDRFGTASVHSERIDDPIVAGAPALSALIGAISSAAEAHANALVPHDHPWVAARPARALIRSWCVMTHGEGWEQWHTHPGGWMSGGYYIRVPRAVSTGEDRAGCLALGLPAGIAGETGATLLGERILRPATGSLILFPSHIYHRTYPHGADDRRICLAFDISPA